MSAAMLRGPKLSSSMSLHHLPSTSGSYVNLNAESAEATISRLSKSVVGYHFCQEKLNNRKRSISASLSHPSLTFSIIITPSKMIEIFNSGRRTTLQLAWSQNLSDRWPPTWPCLRSSKATINLSKMKLLCKKIYLLRTVLKDRDPRIQTKKGTKNLNILKILNCKYEIRIVKKQVFQ